MSELLVVQHHEKIDVGNFAHVLREENVGIYVADLTKTLKIPNPRNFAGILSLGSPESANDLESPKIRAALSVAATALEHSIPYLGICLGLHVAVKAGGGNVRRCDEPEMGTHTVDGPSGVRYVTTITPEGRKSRLLEGLPVQIETVQVHNDTVELTSDMKRLGEGNVCKEQIVKVALNAFGIQEHIEVEKFEEWVNEAPELKARDGHFLKSEFRKAKSQHDKNGHTVMRSYIDIMRSPAK